MSDVRLPTASLMIWSPQEILAYASAHCADDYRRRAGSVKLTDCSAIPAQSLILTGTPGGVSFHPLNIWYAGAYLQPGDRVVARGTYLGVLNNLVSSAP